MKRILYFAEGWGTGGIESVLMGLFRSKAFQDLEPCFDLFCICDWNNGFDDEICRLGGARTAAYPGERPGLVKKLIGGIRGFNRMLSSKQYDVVHVNATNGLGFVYSFLALLHGVPVRVVHSHNSDYDNPRSGLAVKRAGHALGKALFGWSATKRIACSELAGKFLFGPHAFSVISNGIDVDRFRYNKAVREEVRSEWGVCSGDFVVGCLGRVDARKNPLFQLEVFAAVLENRPDAWYVMAGDGSMREETLERARELSVDRRLKMLPATSHPERYYSALDAMLAPSVTEGFGLVAIEAQCSGLPIIVSDAFPQEVLVSEFAARLPLSVGASPWAKNLLALSCGSMNNIRVTASSEFAGGPFDSKVASEQIVKQYG